MHLHLLPTELLDAICHRVAHSDLAALSATHSAFLPVAQRLLYRHISIDCLSRSLSIVITLARKPHLACYVRSFAIRLYSHSVLFNSFYQLLRSAISAMSEITSLDIFADQSTSWVLRTSEDAVFPRLVHFACSYALDSHVVHFLQKTNSLLELELDSVPSSNSIITSSLPVAALPCLSEFIGSSEAAEVIVPGRPVHSIHLNSGDLTSAVADSIAQSSAHVVVLGATTSSLPVPLLQLLAQRMQYLVYLRIMTTHNFAGAPDAAFYENVASALASLPDLKAFELSGMHWPSSPKAVNDGRIWQSEPLNTGFSANDNLLDIDTYSDHYFSY